MYLSYAGYREMGGTLTDTAYNSLAKKAEYLINSQASGRTGERIAKLTECPDCVKECVFELVTLFDANKVNGRQIASESQSQGGASESVSYVTKTEAEILEQCERIVYEFLTGGGFGYLLYRGASL